MLNTRVSVIKGGFEEILDLFPELNEKKINKINFKQFIWFIEK